jgi:tripartite-type tricarboxylate transporter receptor subunit TctC
MTAHTVLIDRRQLMLTALAGAVSSALPGAAVAQVIDTQRVLVGFPAGGTVDAVARRVADKLRGAVARVAVVENKPGAGGRLGVEELRRAAPDGSTLLVTPAAMITLYPHLYSKLSYTAEDLTPVCSLTQVVFGLGVGPAVPASVKTLKDFIAWAKANNASANYGSPGAGTPPHFVGALLEKESGADLRHVPYRGSAPGIQDLLGGQVTSFVGPVGDFINHVKTGKLRILATTGAKRSRFAPDVPTFTELGFPALEQHEWYGVFLPGKASPELVQRLAAAIRTGMNTPDTIEALAQLGIELAVNTPAEQAKAVKDETAAWAPIVKRIGFTPES